MKKIWIILLLVVVLAAGSVAGLAIGLNGKRVKGSGNRVTKQVTVAAYDAIDASRAVKVVVAERPQGSVLIEADDNLIDYVVVEVDEKELVVGFDKQVSNISDIHVTVTVPMTAELRALKASSAASIECPGPLTAADVVIDASSAARIEAVVKTESCRMEASSAAQIKVDVQTETCRIDASSASKIDASVIAQSCYVDMGSAANANLRGKAMTCDLGLSSAARFHAGEFVVGSYKINASSGAKASVNCLAALNADLSSGATVKYTGECSCTVDASSGGRVEKE